jgi:small-conductance mechanosensitive channel
MELFGIRFVGVNAENGQKLALSLIFLVLVMALRWLLKRLLQAMYRRRPSERLRFWARQGVAIGTTVLLVMGWLSIWFDNPTRLAAGLGLVTAGLAFALQRVVTAIAGYVVILRGDLFTAGDRITLGGVRGDVIGLGFTTTQIFEMGQPPADEAGGGPTWVRSRQPTGRIVSVSNARVFDEPVFNYSSEFDFIWEEVTIPISYSADRDRAESILLEAARSRTQDIVESAASAMDRFSWRYAIENQKVEPKVYYRLTDNWLELTVRFITPVRGVRELKDELSRDILKEFDAAGIELASSTFEIVGIPELRIRRAGKVADER